MNKNSQAGLGTWLRGNGWLAALAVGLMLLAFVNLSSYPLTWFDEGSHLHVPKTLVEKGVYADYSSEGFRFYGPTVGVGPTVFLPIALMFKLFGVGLFQARMVVALYLLAAVVVFLLLARRLSGPAASLAAVALLVSSNSINLIEYGRQVLGEVPALFFLLAGLVVLFNAFEKPTLTRLAAAGLLFGLSLVTKNQFLILIGPGLAFGFFLNLIYYRAVPQRVFLVSGSIALFAYLAWQFVMIFQLGPASASENWALFRQATSDSAIVFSTVLMKNSLSQLLSIKTFWGLLVPALLYGLILAIPRRKEGLRWGVVYIMIATDLAWYILGSIGWLRYAFPALSLSSLLVAKLIYDLAGGFQLDWRQLLRAVFKGEPGQAALIGRGVLLAWLAVMVAAPLALTIKDVVLPAENTPQAMAAYLDAHVDRKALVETWEPEMGFLSGHNYHFPPPGLLYVANSYIWLGKAAPASQYDFVQKTMPDYVLVGAFSSWVQLYPQTLLDANYRLETQIGAYLLYAKK